MRVGNDEAVSKKFVLTIWSQAPLDAFKVCVTGDGHQPEFGKNECSTCGKYT